MPLQKPDLRLLTTVAIVILAAICVSGMRADWAGLAVSPMVMGLLCSHCISLLETSAPFSRTALAMTFFLVRAALVSLAVFALYSLLIRWWNSRRFAAAICSLRLARIPARLARLSSELQVAERVDVILSKEPLAFCYGLFWPRICLSSGLLDFLSDAELKAVFCHEYHHQKIHAPLWLFAADSLAAALFFIPIFGDLRNSLVVSVERAADRYAVEQTGRSTLARALYRLLNHSQPSPGIAQPLAVGLSVTSVRIAELLGERAPRFQISALNILLSVGSLLGLICLLWPGMLL